MNNSNNNNIGPGIFNLNFGKVESGSYVGQDVSQFVPTISGSIVGGDLLQSKVYSEMTSKINLLNVSNLIPGEPFIGLVWCCATTNTSNKFKPDTYDVRIQFIDSEGTIHVGTRWSHEEKLNITETPLIITGVATEYFDDKSKLGIRIESLRYYDQSVSRSYFVKDIEGLAEERQKFIESIKTHDPNLDTFMNNIMDRLSLIDTISNSVYKHTLGTKLGAKFIVGNMLLENLGYLTRFNKKFDSNKYKLIIFNYLVNLQLTQDEEGEKMISTNLVNIILGSGLLDLPQYSDVLQSCLACVMGSSVDNSTEAKIFKENLRAVEGTLKYLGEIR